MIGSIFNKNKNPPAPDPERSKKLLQEIAQNDYKPDLRYITELIDKGATLDETTSGGESALNLAIDKGYTDIALLLIKRGADFNSNNHKNRPALHVAVEKGDLDVITALINAKADVNAQAGYTPLMIAAKNGRLDIILMLLAAGAEPNIPHMIYQATALHYATDHNQERMMDIFRKLSGIGFPAPAPQKNSPSQNTEHAQMVRVLLRHGGIIDGRDSGGVTPLMYAAESGNLESVEVLLDNGADINAQTPAGLSALMLAVSYDRIDVVKYLLGKKALPHLRTHDGETALTLAMRKGNQGIIREFQARGITIDPKQDFTVLLDAAGNGDIATVRSMIDKGADINTQNDKGETALIRAIREEHVKIVRLLLENGADISLRDKNDNNAFDHARGTSSNSASMGIPIPRPGGGSATHKDARTQIIAFLKEAEEQNRKLLQEKKLSRFAEEQTVLQHDIKPVKKFAIKRSPKEND